MREYPKYPGNKTRKRHYQNKEKLQTSISYEYRCKNPQQNISKLNLTIYEKDNIQLSIIINYLLLMHYFSDASRIQYP